MGYVLRMASLSNYVYGPTYGPPRRRFMNAYHKRLSIRVLVKNLPSLRAEKMEAKKDRKGAVYLSRWNEND